MMQKIVYSFATLFVCITSMAASDSDWEANCGTCRCLWKLGKKSADCSNTLIGTVPKDLSSELQVIDLSNNFIPKLYETEFINANLQNLHKLFVRNNTIDEVHPRALQGLHILIELDLSLNGIRYLQPGTFAGLAKLRIVILNNNRIDRLEDRLFESLQHLHKIEFKNNQIHRLGQNVFVNLPALQSINLDFNRLSLLRRETFVKLDRLKDLSLTENPWNCTCELRPFRDFAIDRNLYTTPTSCSGPRDLIDKHWNDVESSKFACRPKIISPRPGSYLTAAKDNVTLTCRVRGSPMDIQWLFNKRNINVNDKRIRVQVYAEPARANGHESNEVYTSDLTISNLRSSDQGTYVCKAINSGGHDEAEIIFDISSEVFEGNLLANTASDYFIIVALTAIALLVLLIVIMIFICCYCRRVRSYSKNNTMAENGLIITTKLDGKQIDRNESMLEGGSVIREMQKSLLTEVNPVEKPPRRADVDSSSQGDPEENGDVKRTLLDESLLANHDDETQSVALSDATPRSRQVFLEDNYGSNLPPDLLKFSNRFPQSPSIQSSLTNLQDGRIYGKSPLGSPIYHHAPLGYSTTMTPAGFRTLQHPKIGKTIAIAPLSRSNSPFTPAPLIFPSSGANSTSTQPTIIRQGYVTIPRKQRAPSWAPSANSTVIDYPPAPLSSASIASSSTADIADPIYDNLGMRTTASGYSTLELNRKNGSAKYTMKDRPLPATPKPGSVAALHELAHALQSESQEGQSNSDTEPLYGGGSNNGSGKLNGIIPRIVNGNSGSTKVTTKIPPRPPPKPKKKTQDPNMSKSQLIEEGDDGTEV